jgi:hypothetical protein
MRPARAERLPNRPERLPNRGQSRPGRGESRPDTDERGAERGWGSPACSPVGARAAATVPLSKERLPLDWQRLPGRSRRSSGDAPRRAGRGEGIATNGEGLSEGKESSREGSARLADRGEMARETSESGSGNREGGSRTAERLPKNGRSVSPDGRPGSGQTRGTPLRSPRRNSHPARVTSCHSGSLENEQRGAGSAERLFANDESVSPRVPARRLCSLVRALWNLRVKIGTERRSANARGVPRDWPSVPRDPWKEAQRKSQTLRSESTGSAGSPGLPALVLRVPSRSLGRAPDSPGGSAHSLSVSRSAKTARKPRKCAAPRFELCHACHRWRHAASRATPRGGSSVTPSRRAGRGWSRGAAKARGPARGGMARPGARSGEAPSARARGETRTTRAG